MGGRRVGVERRGGLDSPQGQLGWGHALDVEHRPVGVVDPALAGEAYKAAEDLPAGLLAGVAALDAGDRRLGEWHQHPVRARRQGPEAREQGHEPGVEPHEAGYRLAQVGGQSLQLRRLHEAARLLDPGDRHVERGCRRADPRNGFDGEGAQGRAARCRGRPAPGTRPAGCPAERGWMPRAPSPGARVRRPRRRGRSRAASAPLACWRARRGARLPAQQPSQVALRLHAEERFVRQRGGAVGRGGVGNGPIHRLRSSVAEPLRAVLVEERLEVTACVRGEHGQDVGQRDRRGGLRDRHGRAVVEHRRADGEPGCRSTK